LKPGDDLLLESTICNEIRQHRRPVVISDVGADPLFRDHPTPKQYGFQSYISIPIVRHDGRFFGTLCALDPQPAKLDSPDVLKSLELFAQLIGAQLDIEEQLQHSRGKLTEAVDTGARRERFIAMLGHDLRNPLHLIGLSIEAAVRTPLEPPAQSALLRARRSLERMGEMIDNILDFASGEFAGGIPLTLARDNELAGALQHAIVELREAHPGRALEVQLAIDVAVRCDRHRLAQMLSNLLANALTHGSAEQPVRVIARCDERQLELAVSNGGTPIPPEAMAQLFHPFTRIESKRSKPGLGLGLFIANEIAKAHGGSLSVSSSAEDGTRFVFRMPLEE
jgi:signal transduction histidine kinase